MLSLAPSQLEVFRFYLLQPHAGNDQVGLLFGLILITIFVSVYLFTSLLFWLESRSQNPVKVPPTVPYIFPFVGSAISFGLNPAKCLSRSSQKAGPQAVYGLKVLNKKLYFLFKPENIATLWKYKATITTPNVTTFVLKTLFGMEFKAYNMYTKDTSGILPKPKPTSNIAPHNRIDYLTHANFHKHLLGEGLSPLFQRFTSSFVSRLPSLNIQDEWMEHHSIMDFWMLPLTASMNEALAGPVLEEMSPNFTSDLLEYFPYIQDLMKGLPKCYIPDAYRLRRKLTNDVKKWHARARAQFKETDLGQDGHADHWWGSAFMRERQNILQNVDSWDHDAMASSDFGIFWGASVNIHPMAIWTIIQVFRDRELLSRVRAELSAANFKEITSKEDIDKLHSLPLLQSIHAEMLRLRVEVQTVFTSDQEDIRINEWRFPKKSLIIVPAGAAHRDPNIWNTKNGKHPLTEFWADRFLAYPNDPHSGPKKINGVGVKEELPHDGAGRGDPKFVTSGLANSYMPYGIGERMCPGRGFSRREIITFCAFIVDRFDIEILSTEKDFELSPAFYGIGTQRPLRKIPFKVRNRKVERSVSLVVSST